MLKHSLIFLLAIVTGHREGVSAYPSCHPVTRKGKTLCAGAASLVERANAVVRLLNFCVLPLND